jgi:cytochrome c553
MKSIPTFWITSVLTIAAFAAAQNVTGSQTAATAAATLSVSAKQSGTNYTLLTYREAQWYGSTFWTGPDWTRVGKDWHHPGQNTPSVRRFTVPRDGRVTITGRVFKLHVGGDGIRASLRHKEQEIWQAEIEGNDDKGVELKLTLAVKQGDALRCIVDKRGNYGCDTTGWDPSVQYAGGERFQASASFSAHKQGEGGWFYEMLGEGRGAMAAATPAAPVAVPVPPELKQALARQAGSLAPDTELALLELALKEWWREDKLTDTAAAYAAAITNHLSRAQQLAADLRVPAPPALALLSAAEPASLPDWRARYVEVRLLKRQIALRNPLLDFDKLVFCQRVPPSWSHEVAQYFGWRQRPGGGLFVLEKPGRSLAVRNIVGQQLPAGNFLEPLLSYDGRRIAFSHVECLPQPPNPKELPVNETGDEKGYFHLYEIGVDGRGLRQLTRGPYDDLMPCYLPDGGLAFVSTRRRAYSRCFGPEYSQRWHSYTLHRMNADGSQIRILSLNDVSEWFPTVAHDGQILFARWDYIDRDAVTHQNLWAVRPDGSNPTAVWGNATPKPHCTFQAKPIPGSQKLVFIASAHHAITGGPVCLLDPAVHPNSQDAITRLTPGAYPEAEPGRIEEYYESPWPLSEKYFLVAYSAERLRFQGEHQTNPNPDHALGLYLLDAAGNRELLYRDPNLSSTSPMPLRPRPVPPVLPSALSHELAGEGEMLVTDVYQGLGDIPRGAVKELRIVQIFPKTTYVANQPRVGVAGEENARAILGAVPVEADGSARFLLPAHKPVLFQALDGKGFALQTMRSLTYVQPGERTSCVGCHEHRMSAPPETKPLVLAMSRPPSRIAPGELGGRPFSYVAVVQPVLDRHCVRCHGGEKTEKVNLTGAPLKGFTQSYWALCGTNTNFREVRQAGFAHAPAALVPRFMQRNQVQTTAPGGEYGALGSGLMNLVRTNHYEARLTDAETRRLAAWIDCNAIFYGSFDPAEQAKQLAGETIPMPSIQ